MSMRRYTSKQKPPNEKETTKIIRRGKRKIRSARERKLKWGETSDSRRKGNKSRRQRKDQEEKIDGDEEVGGRRGGVKLFKTSRAKVKEGWEEGGRKERKGRR